MSFGERMYDFVNSKFTVNRLLFGFLISILLDILSTLFMLTFLPATYEKNIIALHLISKFGNFWGLIISVPFEFVILGILFIIFYILLYVLKISLKNIMEKQSNIFYMTLRIVLFIAIVLHLNGVRNNLLLMARLIFEF